MLVGFDYEDGETSDDGLPVTDEIVPLWQPGGRRNSVSSAFSSCPGNLVGLDQDHEEESQLSRHQAAQELACPVERLLRLALLVNSPQQYAPEPSRKRRRTKKPKSLGELLAVVISKPDQDPAPHYRNVERRLGYHEFERRFGLDVNEPVRTVRNRATQLWVQASRRVQHGWGILAQVCRLMYERIGARTRILKAPPGQPAGPLEDGLVAEASTRPVIGVLCTWMLELGLDDPQVLQAVAGVQQGVELVEILKNISLYSDAFHAFQLWVESQAATMGFRSHAASMELCLNGSVKHRVHVHAFLGPFLDMMSWECRQCVIALDLETMGWNGVRPHIRLLRPKRAAGGVRAETIGGLYYVLMEKPGTMFRGASRWPFLDFCNVRTSVTGRYVTS